MGEPSPEGRGRSCPRIGRGAAGRAAGAEGRSGQIMTAQRVAPRGPRTWWRAFVGFYPPRDASAQQLDPVAKFLYSARSVILVISAQAALIAGLLAIAVR